MVMILVSLYGTVRGYASSSPYAIVGLAFVLALAYWSINFTFQLIYRGGPPPTRLRLSHESIELLREDGRVHFCRRWDDPAFSLTLRDFRALPQSTPMSKYLFLDTGDHQIIIAGVLPSRIPESGLLTPEAYGAILAEARQRGLSITPITRRGLTGDEGWGFYHTKIQISRPGT